MTKPLQLGILGCARIVRRAIAAAVKSAPSARLAAIASRDSATAHSWAREFEIPKVHDSYEALIADPAVDAVYIPLPNELHRRWVLAAAAVGKHVLCEKPLALDYAEAQEMVEVCAARGVVLMEAFMWRHHPRVAHARAMLHEGKLGELRLVKLDFSFDIDRRDWRLDPRRGGGALYDLGCYGINAARLFTGTEPVEVLARARRYETGVDMTTSLLLHFPGDVMALLDASFECQYRKRLELVGTSGSLVFPEGMLPPPESELIYRHGDALETISISASDQYREQIECFCASIAAGRLLAPAENGLANMKVLDAARRKLTEISVR